jgi:hypothetical protein
MNNDDRQAGKKQGECESVTAAAYIAFTRASSFM